jgi:16S rRNA (cytosine1402-N4)-methyltransferase
MNDFKHITVLLNEAVEALEVRKGSWYIDATLGGGGHAGRILELGGSVIGIDQDKAAVEFVREKFKSQNSKIKIEEGNFAEIVETARKHDLVGRISGVLFDLGVSSFQIDQSGRGFSIRRDEPLDMRMSETGQLTAAEVVNRWSVTELEEIFLKYGEEERARQIAEVIVEQRAIKPFENSRELASFIETTVKRSGEIPARQASQAREGVAGRHPATRVFQAIRIVVNKELEALKTGLKGAMEVLETGGRVSVISFHSLEDRITKQSFREFEAAGIGRVITKKPITPTEAEVQTNRRARSGKLRVIEKI